MDLLNTLNGFFKDTGFWQRVGIGMLGVSLMVTGIAIVVITSKPAREVLTTVTGAAGIAASKTPLGAGAKVVAQKVVS